MKHLPDPAGLDCEEVGDVCFHHRVCFKAILWACVIGAVVGFVTGWAL